MRTLLKVVLFPIFWFFVLVEAFALIAQEGVTELIEESDDER